jgi:putative isomerase
MPPCAHGPTRRWNTWDARYPACAVHQASGLTVHLSAFSASAGRGSDFGYSPEIRLGPHLLDGSYAELELPHAGSRLRLRFASEEDGSLVGEVEVLETAEWSLRFWFLMEFGLSEGRDGRVRLRIPAGDAAYVDPPIALAQWPGGAAAFGTDVRPVAAHLYDEPAEALEEFETRGYYYRPPKRQQGRWVVLRFNAVTPRVGFAARIGEDARAVADGLAELLSGGDRILAERRSTAGQTASRQAAVRDVVAWNTVWDPVNDRAYTPTTRAWVTHKFGGWIIWQIDAFFNAILAAHAGDLETATANIEAAMTCRTPEGMLAALRSGLTNWIDRSHPPVGAHAVRSVYLRAHDVSLLERCYPVLAGAYDWWFRTRDGNGNGLLEYGSSPIGDGHFVHTKLGAMDESANDNSPVHDEAIFDVRSHTLDMEDVGLNSLLVHEGEMLARMAEELDLADEARAHRERAQGLARKIREHLWDEERGIFANRLWDGRFARSVAPPSFYPLLAGVATPEQAERMVREWLTNPRRFGGDFPIAGTPHEDPAAGDNVYWRGRVWPPFNYLVYRGLRRYRFDEEAADLAARGAAMFDREWAERRCFENFNQRTGEGGDSVDAEHFYTWGALLPMLADIDLLDLDPLEALVFGAVGARDGAASLAEGGRTWRVEVAGFETRLFLNGELFVVADFTGRFRDLRVGAERISLVLPARAAVQTVRVRPRMTVRTASVGDRPIALEHSGSEITLRVPAGREPQQLVIELGG